MLEIGDYNFRICICCFVPSNKARKSGMGFIPGIAYTTYTYAPTREFKI